jgi:hypothetical protein
MLFFTNEASASSGDKTVNAATSTYTAEGLSGQINNLKTALQNFVIGSNPQTILENANKALISMNDQALSLQRTMGGFVTGAAQFRERLTQAYHETLDIGASFQDVTDAVEGLAASMGKMVNPSKEVLVSMVTLSKSTGIASKDVAGMVGELSRLGGTQTANLLQMEKIADSARKSGLSAKGLMTTVKTGLKDVSGFGFKNGIDGLTKMAKQAMVLRTTMETLGAKGLQAKVLDPEGAIETAAAFQMMGGAVGKLADPFQLLHMAQTDMAGLQEELVKSTKSAFSFNKETGKFDIATQDMYRLREQANLTGSNLEDLVNAGREAAKLDMLKDKFGLDSLDEDSQNLIAGLAEIGEGGKVSIDIPGFKKLEADTAEQLQAQLKDADTRKALDDYQAKAALSEKDLAVAQMTITENQAKDVNIIKEAVLKGFTQTERDDLLKDIEKANKAMGDQAITASEAPSDVDREGLKAYDKGIAESADQFRVLPAVTTAYKELMGEITKGFENTSDVVTTDNGVLKDVKDLFLPKDGKPMVMSEGAIYKGIVGDQVAMGTNIDEIFNSSGKLVENMSQNNQTLGGALDLNINLSGRVNGDNNSDLNKLFSSPIFQKQLMDMVLYKMKDYQKQQGVL